MSALFFVSATAGEPTNRVTANAAVSAEKKTFFMFSPYFV